VTEFQATRRLAAVYRSPYLAIAVLSNSEIIAVRRFRPPTAADVAKTIAKTVGIYDPDLLVVEPSLAADCEALFLKCPMRLVSLDEAKRVMIENVPRPTIAELCHALIAKLPSLRRFVKVLSGTGRIAMSERWRTVMLLPVTLAFAAMLHAGKDYPPT